MTAANHTTEESPQHWHKVGAKVGSNIRNEVGDKEAVYNSGRTHLPHVEKQHPKIVFRKNYFKNITHIG
jgi:hypothetical protein